MVTNFDYLKKEPKFSAQDNLQSLMNSEDYRQTIGPDLWKRMDYIRRSGNNAAHSSRKLGRDEAMLCLENLFIYLDYIAYCYSDQYQRRAFDKTLITARIEKAKKSKEDAKAAKEALEKEQEKAAQQELDLKKLSAENASLREELSAVRNSSRRMFPNRWNCPSIRRENFISIPC